MDACLRRAYRTRATSSFPAVDTTSSSRIRRRSTGSCWNSSLDRAKASLSRLSHKPAPASDIPEIGPKQARGGATAPPIAPFKGRGGALAAPPTVYATASFARGFEYARFAGERARAEPAHFFWGFGSALAVVRGRWRQGVPTRVSPASC